MVMDCLGQSLEDIFVAQNKKMTVKSVFEIHYHPPFLGPDARRPDDLQDRVHTLQAIPAPRHQARQLPDGQEQAGLESVCSRLRIGQEVHDQGRPHPLPGGQEPDRDCSLCISQHPHGARAVQER